MKLTIRFICLIICNALATFGVQALPITMPSVRIEPVAGSNTSAIATYQPFNVIATFSRPYCLSLETPIYSAVSLNQGTLNLVLSHLKTGPCSATRILPIAGLPAGTYTIRLSITGGDKIVGTDEVEAGSATLTVSQSTLIPQALRMFTARIDGGQIKPFGTYPVEDAPITLTNFASNQDVLNVDANWIEVGAPRSADAYTFKYFRSFVPGELPEPYAPLWQIIYPKPYLGIYATTSFEVARALQAQWHPDRPLLPGTPASAYVLRTNNGTCPLGASPVYQLFHPKVIAHRLTQSMETYTMLAQNGYLPEGTAFCAPSRQ